MDDKISKLGQLDSISEKFLILNYVWFLPPDDACMQCQVCIQLLHVLCYKHMVSAVQWCDLYC